MEITFLGGVGTVTGSKMLVTKGRTRLLVDCGLFQGLKVLRRRNWRSLPFKPKGLSAAALTHAHVDHSGYLPVLVRDGFRGPIFSTPPTHELCKILLPDCGHLQEEDARYANRKRFSRHERALPLYTVRDAAQALTRFKEVKGRKEQLVGNLTIRFVPVGHILGAASIIISDGEHRLLISGDIGRPNDAVMYPPTPPEAVDWVVMESTYGGRKHSGADPLAAIEPVAKETLERGGVLLIPSFAVGRAQSLLFCLHQLVDQGRIPDVPIYLNSPMATKTSDLYRRFADAHRLTHAEAADVFDRGQFVKSVEQSKQLNRRHGPMIVVSASGMLTGGRVLHHLVAYGPDPKNTILLPGYQAPGTRGAALARGAEEVKIHGQWIPMRAQVERIDALSAHADEDELISWLGSAAAPPRQVFITHGEPEASEALRLRIESQLHIPADVPDQGEQVVLA